jgi:hypothetical protein
MCIWCPGHMLQWPQNSFSFLSFYLLEELWVLFSCPVLYLPSDCFSSPYGRIEFSFPLVLFHFLLFTSHNS